MHEISPVVSSSLRQKHDGLSDGMRGNPRSPFYRRPRMPHLRPDYPYTGSSSSARMAGLSQKYLNPYTTARPGFLVTGRALTRSTLYLVLTVEDERQTEQKRNLLAERPTSQNPLKRYRRAEFLLPGPMARR